MSLLKIAFAAWRMVSMRYFSITRREAGEVEITREMELALLALPKTQPAKPGKP